MAAPAARRRRKETGRIIGVSQVRAAEDGGAAPRYIPPDIAPSSDRARPVCSWKRAVIDPRTIAFGFVYMGLNIPQYGLSFFLPPIVKAFGGLSSFEVGLVTAVPYLVGALGMILRSRSSDRTGEHPVHGRRRPGRQL